MNLIIFHPTTGEILRTVSCPDADADLQVQPGERAIIGEANCDRDIVDPATEAVVRGGKPRKPLPFEERRRAAYPSVRDQLDMLWHAMDDGQLPKAEPFYSRILAAKQAVPKTSEK